MKRLLLPFSMIPALLGWYKDGLHVSKYSYNIRLRYESDLSNMQCSHSACVNGKKLTCRCGDDPIMIMIIYGHIQGFCFQHIPRLDTDIDLDNVFEDSDCVCQGYDYEQ